MEIIEKQVCFWHFTKEMVATLRRGLGSKLFVEPNIMWLAKLQNLI